MRYRKICTAFCHSVKNKRWIIAWNYFVRVNNKLTSTVRMRHGTTDRFQIEKGIHQGCILSPCLFNLYAKYIKWNARVDEAQAGIKIARRNINNLKYADDTTLMAESEEELKSHFKEPLKWKRRVKKLA